MTTKPKPKDTPEAEYKRFLETARQVEASEDADAFDEAFGKVVKSTATPKRLDRGK
jgi:hypothetical protein